jgi:hypothetical protein
VDGNGGDDEEEDKTDARKHKKKNGHSKVSRTACDLAQCSLAFHGKWWIPYGEETFFTYCYSAVFR